MAVLPVALFAGLLFYLGQRLLRSGLRSDGAELWLGLSFMCSGSAIVPRFALAQGVSGLPVDPIGLNLVAQALLHLGIVGLAAFVWKTFQPGARWAASLFAAIALVYAVNLVLFRLTGAHASQSHPFHLVLSSCLALVFAWSFIESVRYARAMRKRLELGLADPVVANRFVLFSIWTGCMTLLPVVLTGVRAISLATTSPEVAAAGGDGLAVRADAQWALQVIRIAVTVLGLPMAAAIWLAFFPPRRYRRWIEAANTT